MAALPNGYPTASSDPKPITDRDGRKVRASGSPVERSIPSELALADEAGYQGLVVLKNGRTFIGRPVGMRIVTNRLQFSSDAGITGGMLIGRVGTSRPFAIGAEADITMPAGGRLYLGINDDYVTDNTGDFFVEIFRQ